MKSRSLAAYRIDNRAGTSKLAVIVFESTKCKRFDKRELEIAMEYEGRRIAHLIETMKAFEPDPVAARPEGFRYGVCSNGSQLSLIDPPQRY